MKLRQALIITVTLVTLTACTHNDGDIGPLFGQWKLTEVTIDGVPDSDYDGDIFWQFQNQVVSMRRIDDDHTQHACYGSWSRPSTDIIIFDFTHTDNASPDEDYRYTPYSVTRLPRAKSTLTISRLDNSQFRATYTGDDGKAIGYSLTKW